MAWVLFYHRRHHQLLQDYLSGYYVALKKTKAAFVLQYTLHILKQAQ